MPNQVKVQVDQLRIESLSAGSTDDHLVGNLTFRLIGEDGRETPGLARVKQVVGSTFTGENIEVGLTGLRPGSLDAQDAQRKLGACVANVLTASTGDVRLEPAKLVNLRGSAIAVDTVFLVNAGSGDAGWCANCEAPPNKGMKLTKLRAAPVRRAEVPSCAFRRFAAVRTASQLIPGVRPTFCERGRRPVAIGGRSGMARSACRRTRWISVHVFAAHGRAGDNSCSQYISDVIREPRLDRLL